MSTTFRRSGACCKRPPFHLPDLPLEGEFSMIEGIDTYITGSSSARRGIFVIYDIFGCFPQTFYGADILAHGKNSTESAPTQYRVFVPDFLGFDAAEYAWYPPTTPEKAAALDAFFVGPADMHSTNSKLRSIWRALSTQHPEIEDWAIVGYCWGGEVAQYVVGSELAKWSEGSAVHMHDRRHPFKAMVLLHSGFTVDERIAKALDVPVLALNSGEETEEEMEVFLKGTSATGTKVEVEWFMDMVHGWMSARGELTNEKVMEGFLKGYQRVRDFLGESK